MAVCVAEKMQYCGIVKEGIYVVLNCHASGVKVWHVHVDYK